MRGFGNYFWGFFLIGVGVILIAKYYFKLSISTMRIVGGVFFIALGLTWILGGGQLGGKGDMFFGQGIIHGTKTQDEYNVVFSNGVVDLTTLPWDDDEKRVEVEVNVIFGNGVIRINPDVSTIIKVDGAFSKAEMPDGSFITFGEHSYRIQGTDSNKVLYIDANVVFGNLKIVESQSASI